jgi:hypothetical protein
MWPRYPDQTFSRSVRERSAYTTFPELEFLNFDGGKKSILGIE